VSNLTLINNKWTKKEAKMKNIFLVISLLILSLINLNAQIFEPGDGVRIKFYNINQDDISGDFYTQQNGELQLPYIGQISTMDKDYNLVISEIKSKYNELYTGVELIVLPLYRVSVLGEVRNPGVYYVTGVEKLLDVIALAGGETADSDMSEIYVERKNKEFVFDAEKLIEENGEDGIQDFYLKSGDRVFVSRKWGTSRNTAMMISAAGLLVAIVALIAR
jgi:polysaccharide export outer membrane protein